MKYTYLLINFLTVFFPVILSFDKRVAFYKTWKFIWLGMAITGLLFLVWDIVFAVKGVWKFNPNYILGIRIFELPIEEVLFFLTVPFACIFIYACISHYVKWQFPGFFSDIISSAIVIYSMLNVVLYYTRLYTVVTFGLMAAVIITVQYVLKRKWMPRFYVAYIVSLIPFYIVNGYLTSIPVVIYNNVQNLGIRIGTIPLEDHFYCMTLLLMNIAFYEYYKNKAQSIGT